MTNRVIMGEMPNGEYGLRVSRPGSNVENLSLPQKNVSFDSRWIGSSKILIRGTSGGPATVMYGETLPYIPRVLLLGRIRTTGEWEIATRYSEDIYVEDGSSWTDNLGSLYAQIYNNRIVFPLSTGSNQIYNLYSYIVLRD